VRISSTKPLREFWSHKDAPARSEQFLRAWYDLAAAAMWHNFAELKQTFGSADVVGDCVVFDVGNNRIRLIGRVRYANREGFSGILYVLAVLTHAECDRNTWPDDCGCHKQPPKKSSPRPLKEKPRQRKRK
jgi:mRNA interferase HigB